MSFGALSGDPLPVAVIPRPEISQPVVHLMQVNGHTGVGHAVGHSIGAHAFSGAAAAAGHAVLIGATCLGGAALAVVVTKGVVAGTQRLAQGLAELDEEFRAREECHADACRAAELWQHAACQVVDLNARIAAFGATVHRELGGPGGAGSDPDLPIPSPLEIGCRSLREVYDECAKRRMALEHSRDLLELKIQALAERRRAAALPRIDPALVPTVEQLLADYRTRSAAPGDVAADAVGAAGDTGDTGDTGEVRARINAQLDRVGGAAGAADHAKLLEIAAKALAAKSPRAARPQLDLLERRVDQLLARRERQAEDAAAAARLLEGIEFLNRRDELTPADKETVAALRSVVAGDDELDQTLRDDGARLAAKAHALALRIHQTERVSAMLTELGYEVSAPENRVGAFRAARPEWSEHRAGFIVEGGEFRWHVVRERPVAGDDAARQDRERCAEISTDMATIVERLDAEGVKPRRVKISSAEPVLYDTSPADRIEPESAAEPQLREAQAWEREK